MIGLQLLVKNFTRDSEKLVGITIQSPHLKACEPPHSALHLCLSVRSESGGSGSDFYAIGRCPF